MIKKIYKKQGILPLIFILSSLAKILEWVAQYFVIGNLSHLSGGVWFIQLSFINILSLILFFGFRYLEIKHDSKYLLIPVWSYFLKEVYNLFFVFKEINGAVFIGLFVEPIILLMLIKYLNKSHLRIR